MPKSAPSGGQISDRVPLNPSDFTVVHKRKKAPFFILLLDVILSQLCWEIYMFDLGGGEEEERGDNE